MTIRVGFLCLLLSNSSVLAQTPPARSIDEHMRICMTEKCQGPVAMHCRGETPTKQELRAQCRAEFAAAKKK